MNSESESSNVKYDLKEESDSDVDHNEDSQEATSTLDTESAVKEEITIDEHHLQFPESSIMSENDLTLPQPSKEKKKETKSKKELEEEEREKMQ